MPPKSKEREGAESTQEIAAEIKSAVDTAMAAQQEAFAHQQASLFEHLGQQFATFLATCESRIPQVVTDAAHRSTTPLDPPSPKLASVPANRSRIRELADAGNLVLYSQLYQLETGEPF